MVTLSNRNPPIIPHSHNNDNNNNNNNNNNNFLILINGVCTNKNIYYKINQIRFSEILSYEFITISKAELVLIKKKKRSYHVVGFACSADYSKERWKAEQIPRSCQRTEKLLDHKGDADSIRCLSHWNNHHEPKK